MVEENLVRYIAENLVNNPEQVQIKRKDSNRTVVLELSVAPDDMGRVIGRSGRVANAIRALLRAASSGDDDHGNERRRRVVLEIE